MTDEENKMNRYCISCSKPVEVCTCYNYSREQIIALLNENKELRIRLEEIKNTSILINENNQLKEEIAKLKEQIAELKEQNTLFSTELIACNERCKDLEEVNEKMNCCGNCKHYKQTNNYLVGTCKGKYYIEGNNICDKWELAE